MIRSAMDAAAHDSGHHRFTAPQTLDNIPFEIQYLVPDRWYPSLCSVAVVDTFDTSLPV